MGPDTSGIVQKRILRSVRMRTLTLETRSSRFDGAGRICFFFFPPFAALLSLEKPREPSLSLSILVLPKAAGLVMSIILCRPFARIEAVESNREDRWYNFFVQLRRSLVQETFRASPASSSSLHPLQEDEAENSTERSESFLFSGDAW